MPDQRFPPPPKKEEVRDNPDEPTETICLSNILKIEDLEEDEEFQYTYDDIHSELSNYGKIIKLVLPRPNEVKVDGDKKPKYPESALLKVY